jgi:hypothetical protein
VHVVGALFGGAAGADLLPLAGGGSQRAHANSSPVQHRYICF